MATHAIDATRIHHEWNRDLPPTLSIRSGDDVWFDLRMAGHGQVRRGAPASETEWDDTKTYHLLGPVWVEDAAPGDTLEVEVLELVPGGWGWTAVLPGLGLIPEDFPTAFLRYFDLEDGSTTQLGDSVRIPLAPFLGTMGTHPGEPEIASVFPPHRGGGNIDTRHLVQGSTLSLPVWCEGALFSCGDPHAAQGDGEVCVSAIECAMQARLRFVLRKETIPGPRFLVPTASASRDPGGYFGTMGIGPDLFEGARSAVRAMTAWLVAERGLDREDAYVLCSLAGDLKLLEVVDDGVWNVGCTLPLSLFSAP